MSASGPLGPLVYCRFFLATLDGTFITPDRRQSKTILTIKKKHGLKIARNSVFDCHMSPQLGDKWQSKTLFLTIFYLRSSIVLLFLIAAYPVCYPSNNINNK